MQKGRIPYSPRYTQEEIHKSLKRFNVIVCHRRFGKSVMLINELIKCALTSKKPNARFHYFAPSFKQAKEIVWDYVKLYTKDLPVVYNEAELRCDFPNGARIRLQGSVDPDSARGIYSDGVVFDEYQDTDPRIWTEVMRPAVSDRKGFVIFSGTPKGHNHFYDMLELAKQEENWYWSIKKASETNVLDKEELELARLQMSKEEYSQEYECSFEGSLKGAYYSDYISEAFGQNRVTNVTHDPMLQVHTAWDLGIDDSTTIWFYQQTPASIRLIDYYESRGVGFDHYIRVLDQKRDELKYRYQMHHFPHDVRVKELGTGKSRIETLVGLGMDIKTIDIVPNIGVNDGINAVRLILGKCWFDLEKCRQGIEALKQYRQEWDNKLQRFKDRPFHDWTSHAADAFRYLAVTSTQDSGIPQTQSNPVTLNDYLREHDNIMEERRDGGEWW